MFKKLALWGMVLVATALIFFFSTEPGGVSKLRTYNITEFVARGVGKLIDIDFSKLHYYIRKGAHFFEYLMLAFMMSLALRNSSRRSIKQSIVVFLLCILFACFDEGIQLFTAGRSGRIHDVIIDSFGALMGIMMHSLVCRICLCYNNHKHIIF